MAVVPFYHYTNYSGMEGIKRCGYIRIGSFTHFDRGVYGTTLGPNEGKIAIAKNNWTRGWKKRMEEGRMDYAILVYLPCDKVIKCKAGRRNIYRYIGAENLDLCNYKWEVVRVP